MPSIAASPAVHARRESKPRPKRVTVRFAAALSSVAIVPPREDEGEGEGDDEEEERAGSAAATAVVAAAATSPIPGPPVGSTASSLCS